MEDDVELVAMSFLSLYILSAITFSTVLIHFALMPTFEPISRPQKNLARALPIINYLLVCSIQLSALVLSVTHKTSGCRSLLTLVFSNMTRDAQ
jgi:hypothetical protein